MRLTRLVILSVVLTFLPLGAQAQGTPAPKDALLYFIWPLDGSTIKGAFWCRFGLRNMGVTHAGDGFQNSGHHHLLIDVNEPLDSNEPIPQDRKSSPFRRGPDRGAHRIATREAYASARLGGRQALSLQPTADLEEDQHHNQMKVGASNSPGACPGPAFERRARGRASF